MKISRRALAQLALGGAAAAQQPVPDDLDQARKRVQQNADALREKEVAMSTEPAFLFRA